MEIRTTSKLITFRNPFTLSALDRVYPAGDYTVRIEEQPLDTVSFAGWRQTACLLGVFRDGAVGGVKGISRVGAVGWPLLTDLAEAIRLSRVQAQGWNAARKARLTVDGRPARIANPYSAEPDRSRWQAGFDSAQAVPSAKRAP